MGGSNHEHPDFGVKAYTVTWHLELQNLSCLVGHEGILISEVS